MNTQNLIDSLAACLAYTKAYYKKLPDDGPEQDYIMQSVIEPAEKAIAEAKA